jgi:hypothetical protein
LCWIWPRRTSLCCSWYRFRSPGATHDAPSRIGMTLHIWQRTIARWSMWLGAAIAGR